MYAACTRKDNRLSGTLRRNAGRGSLASAPIASIALFVRETIRACKAGRRKACELLEAIVI